ncbi:hypothetical protein DEV91_1404 [Phyllobacterium brassicacearum]|nr:hypothetical protein DEV91_1404 [Phyllobacterium brassicacearum]
MKIHGSMHSIAVSAHRAFGEISIEVWHGDEKPLVDMRIS